MTRETAIKDNDFGNVIYRHSSRAKRYSITSRAGQLIVVIPQGGSLARAKGFLDEFRDKIKTKWDINHLIERTEPQKDDRELLTEARAYLPGRLKELAIQHGFVYHRLTLRNSKTRWGSCSSKKNINLSIYLMRLPKHLIDYVILHELCHLTHLNHSPAFWALLDTFTANQSKAFRKELKQYACR